MATLYELTGQMLDLMELMEDPDVDEQIIKDTLEAMNWHEDFENKADGYAKVDRSLKAEEEALKDEIDRLTARKNTISNNRKRLKDALERAMILTGKLKFKTTLFSFGIQKNPPSVNVKDESKVPEQFWIKHDPTLNKKALIDYVKNNGNTDYAELIQTEGLRIR